VPFLRERLRPIPHSEPKELARLLAELDHPRYAVRAAALRELQRRGETAAPALRQALKGNPSLELRRRVEARKQLLDPANEFADWVRTCRALEVLERADTDDARKLLGELAEGAPEARLTIEAAKSLERVAGRAR
jgi:hypothetical protein